MALNKLNHIYGEPLVVSSLNTTGDAVVDGSLTVLGGTTFVGAVSFGNVTNAELNYLDGLTGAIQPQLDARVTATQVAAAYAALSGATFTGAISATGLTLTNDLTIANGGTGLSATTKGGIFVGTSTSAFTNLTVGTDGWLLTADSAQASGVKWAAAPVSLPTQTGNNGKYLTTDGTSASWVTLGSSIPTQTGNSGKFLTTDGTTASWYTLTASDLTGGTLSSTILGNSTVYIGSTPVALNRTTGDLNLNGISSVTFPGSTSGITQLKASSAAGAGVVTLPPSTGTLTLRNDTTYIGTTAVTLNRSSANQALTGISSVALPGSTSGTITLQPAATAGTNTITLPAATGTVDLQGNTFYVGTTSIANNRASGAQTLTGVSIDGNAATATTASSVTNGLTTSNYSTYAIPKAGGTLTGLLIGAPGPSSLTISNHNDAGNFSVRSVDNAGAAAMSFHRPGIYATNMGIDTDNVFKIGGWSAGIMISLTGSNCTLPGTLTINSDIKLKENLVPITGALDKVHALTGYNYNRIGFEKLEMGVVAQEVQAILPELVEADSEGTLSVAYQNMVALLIEAVKEQSIKIASLEEQVKELRG